MQGLDAAEHCGQGFVGDTDQAEPALVVPQALGRDLLEAGALGAVLSGSGPTVVGVARSEPHARQIRRNLEAWRKAAK